MNSDLTYTISLDEFPVGSSKLINASGRQVAVFRIGVDEVYAVDNQCPHEGYPLIKGTVKECVLTCPWHNFKFNLKDGECVKGSEAVGTHPIRLLEDRVEVEITTPPADVERKKFLGSLREGLYEKRMGQLARDVVRLLKLGMTPEELVIEAARFDAIHAEWGTTHGLPVSLDVLNYMDRYPSLQGVYPIMQAMEVACEQYHHYPPRKIPEPIAFAGDTPEFRKKLHDAVENEDIEEAEALFRGALEAGWERPAVEAFLYEVVAAHFLGYGHALIYQVKIFDLLDRCGWEHAPVLLPAFLVRLINWTREDVLPEWGWFRKRVGEVESQFGTWTERQSEGKHLDWDPNQFLTSLISGKRNDALDALTDALGKGVPLVDLVDVLSEGAAERILRFEIATDRANDIQNGWLAITHIATYINALRSAILRFNQPELFRLFYYGVRFINQGKALDGVVSAEVIPEESYSLESDYVHRIEKALVSNDPSQAMGLTQSYLRKFEEACLLEEACQDLVFEDYLVRPIVVGHWIKMTVALFEEYRMSKSPNKEKHLLALMRFGATPIRERWISRVSFEAIQFLEHGKVPKDLM